jgi:hypothetical protein
LSTSNFVKKALKVLPLPKSNSCIETQFTVPEVSESILSA